MAASLKDKVQNALDEGRTLILGAQVLLGAQYTAFFASGYRDVGETAHRLLLAALALLLVAVALLMAPAPYHRLVERGEDSDELLRLVHKNTGRALAPLAVAFVVDLLLAGALVGGRVTGLAAAVAVGATAFALWWGLELIVRRRLGAAAGRTRMGQEKKEETQLKHKIRHVLTEARVVLPGAQALLGFQFSATMTRAFAELPPRARWVHLGSFGAIALATMLLMAPAAYHRIVEAGEETERFHHFASRMVLAALAPLAVGLSGDLFVVVGKVVGRDDVALLAALAVLVALLALWFGWPLARRGRQRRQGRRPTEPLPAR